MNFEVTKLDRRHTGYDVMKYYIEPGYVYYPGHSREFRINKFKEMRNFLWQDFGPGAELEYVTITLGTTSTPDVKPPGDPGIPTLERWAWRTDQNHLRLYLKGDAELTWLKLKWNDDTDTNWTLLGKCR